MSFAWPHIRSPSNPAQRFFIRFHYRTLQLSSHGCALHGDFSVDIVSGSQTSQDAVAVALLSCQIFKPNKTEKVVFINLNTLTAARLPYENNDVKIIVNSSTNYMVWTNLFVDPFFRTYCITYLWKTQMSKGNIINYLSTSLVIAHSLVTLYSWGYLVKSFLRLYTLFYIKKDNVYISRIASTELKENFRSLLDQWPALCLP